MEKIIRKGIAFEPRLLEQFDSLIRKKGYKNRSEAIRDIIRKELVEEDSTNPENNMAATLTIIYNHHEHNVQHELTHVQHHHPNLIRSSLHVHMDKDNCLEVLVLEGKVKKIKEMADNIISMKGIKNGKLVLSSVR